MHEECVQCKIVELKSVACRNQGCKRYGYLFKFAKNLLVQVEFLYFQFSEFEFCKKDQVLELVALVKAKTSLKRT